MTLGRHTSIPERDGRGNVLGVDFEAICPGVNCANHYGPEPLEKGKKKKNQTRGARIPAHLVLGTRVDPTR